MSISVISNLSTLSHTVYGGKDVSVPVPGERQAVSASGKVLPQSADKEVTKMEVSQAIRDILEYMPSLSRELQFEVREGSNNAIITVRDARTMEIVRQIPSEEVIAIARYIAQVSPDSLSGLLLDGRW